MDRHEQFLTHHTLEVLQLLKYTSANLASASSLLEVTYEVVQDSYKYSNSLDILKTMRTVLCLCYQYKCYQDTWKKENGCIQETMNACKKLDINKIRTKLEDQLKNKDFCHWTEVSVVLDVLVLHTSLYCRVPDILHRLEKLQNLIGQYLRERNELTIFHTKLMDCYIDSLLLLKKRAIVVHEINGEKVKASFLQNLQLWLKLKVHKNFDLLVLILPKLIKLVPAGEILTKVWRMIVTMNNSDKTLSMLYLTADVWFPIESEHIKALIDQSLEEHLWLLLLKKLSSLMPQQSKLALQLTKKMVDFVDRHRTKILQFPVYQVLRPLICTGNDCQQKFFKENLKNWFLILEELEVEKEHSVTPAFSTLRNLLKKTPDGFHIAWVRCAFSRILQDAPNVLVKWGLLEVFALDLELCNDEFLSVVLDALNNTSLYEIDTDDGKTTVAKELTIFLNYAETQNTDLVTRFMVQASTKTWDPIPLFHIIHALSMVKKKETTWKGVELKAVKSLAEIISTIRCPILRIGAHIELLEAMTHFATGPLDLVAVANTLSTFPTTEALIRDQLAWKRTSAWLSNTVKETEATLFLESTICGQFADDDSPWDLSIKSLSLIVVLFYDGYLAINSKVSPGFIALCNLLNCLNTNDSTLHVSAELKIRAIEVLDYLLDVTLPKDCILNELVSNYANATLRWTFMNLRTAFESAFFEKMSTYVRITHKLFNAKSSIITERDVLNHIQKFQVESCNIIENGEFDSKVKRFFAVKMLHACLTATSTSLRNYNFIGSLHKTYKNQLTQPSWDAEKGNKACKDDDKLTAFESEYYKLVAELFLEYLKDEPVDKWLPAIDWIKEVLYLIHVGGTDIFAPLVGILSQIFYKQAVGPTCMDHFKSTLRLCWKSILESNECGPATEEILDLMLSSRFLESEETKELMIQCTREATGTGADVNEQSIILLKKLNQVKEVYLCNFYEAILACLLCGTVPSRVEGIELRTRSYVLHCYQEVYPNYFSAMNPNTSVVTRAHAVTLLHKMITDDPAHAVKLLPLIIDKSNVSQNEQDVYDSLTHRLETRILQVLLVLQPILNTGDIESLHSLLCNSILLESNQPSVRIMQEWLLIRIYLESDNLRSKIWNFFDQCQARRVASLCSAMGIVYHVVRLLPPDLQLDFMNHALQRIMPCCMSQQFNVPLYAQVIVTKLYNLATELSYSAITERYKELQAALTGSQEHGDLKAKLAELQDNFYFKNFHPINDYTLQTLFYELPRSLNVPWNELIPTQMFEESGFKKVNNHALKLLDPKSDADLKTKLAEAGNSLVVIDFFATWCGPCKMIAPKLEELSMELQDIIIVKVDVDECEDIAFEYEISSMPTFVFIKNAGNFRWCKFRQAEEHHPEA